MAEFSPMNADFHSPPGHDTSESLLLERNSLKKVLDFLAKRGYKDASAAIQREATVIDGRQPIAVDDIKTENIHEAKIDAAVTSYQSLSEPDRYAVEFKNFLQVMGTCLDDRKAEMSLLLYPVFVHMYLELICNSHGAVAAKFFSEFSSVQESFYADDLSQLKCLKDSSQLKSNVWFCALQSSSYVIRMSFESVQKLKEFFTHNSVFERIINSHIHIEHFDGAPRAKATTEAYSGSILGEATKIANKTKVFYGLLKESTSAAQPVEEDADGDGQSGKKKKNKLKETGVTKRMKADQSHGPPVGRIPLPDLSESVKQDRVKAAKEIAKRVKIGPDRLPSVCFYTVLNAKNGVCCCEMTEDTSQMALGNGNSTVQVWSVDPQKKLRKLKPTDKLERLDKEADDVMEQALDAESSTESLTLVGHSGPVYGVSYSPDKTLLLSASEDSSVRLWSLLTWSNLVAYKTPGFPLWDCHFSPYGHYFATAGADRCGLLWCCDRLTPIRIFAGHFSDVTRVLFHPNSNYVATGSSDRTVRLWDLANGQCVRYFTGHKSTVHSLQFSPDGRTLATGGADGRVLLWDVGMGIMSADIQAHQGRVYSLNYSRDGTVLASGGSDYYVKLHNLQQLLLDSEPIDGVNHNPKLNCASNEQLLAEFPTKATSPLQLHFTRKNLLIAVGAYGQYNLYKLIDNRISAEVLLMSRYHLKRVNIPANRSSANPSILVVPLDKDSVKFGRNPDQVDVVLNSDYYNNMISREHAEIIRRRNPDGTTAYYLLDKSLNGTYVKSIRAYGPVLLHAGDIIHFGHINGAAIKPGEEAPQPDAEFTYVFEKSQRSSPVQSSVQPTQMFPPNNPGGQNLYSPYQHQTPGAQFNPYSFGGSGHPAIMSHLGFAAAYSNLGSMLPAYAAAAQLGAAHQQVLSNAHHPAGPETVGLNMTGGPSWMAYGGAQNPPRPPQQQKQIPPGFRYPQAAVTQPNDFVMGGGSQSAFRHAYFSREGGEMTDPANTLANLHHQQVLINNAAAQQQLRLTRNPVAPVQQQQQQPLLNRSQIGSQPDMKAPPVNNQPQQQFSNRPYGSDPNGASFDQTNPGNFGGISGSNSLDHPEIRPSMSDTNKSEGMSVIMPNFNFAGREVKPPASDYFQPSCSVSNDSINHLSLSALAEVAKRQTDSQPTTQSSAPMESIKTESTLKLDQKELTSQQPLKMECDSSVPSPPATRVNTVEVVESPDINQELLSLARKCVTANSPADEMFDLDTEINRKTDIPKSPVTTRLPHDSGDESSRSSRPKQKLNEVARLLNDISSSSFMFNVRKKCGEISSSTSSSEDESDEDEDKKQNKADNKRKSATPNSMKSPGGSEKSQNKTPTTKSLSPETKKDKTEKKPAKIESQTDSSASESSSEEEDKRDTEESDSSEDRTKKNAKKPTGKKGNIVSRNSSKTSLNSSKSSPPVKGQRKRAEPPSSHLGSAPKGAASRRRKGATPAKSSRRSLPSKLGSQEDFSSEEEQLESDSDSDYEKPANKRNKTELTKRKTFPLMKKNTENSTSSKSNKRSQKSSVTKKPKPRKRKASESSSSDHSISPEPVAPSNPTLHNPDIPCAAEKKCKKPQSANVVWIACDDCEKWYHVDCVDCDPEAAEDENFQFHCGCE